MAREDDALLASGGEGRLKKGMLMSLLYEKPARTLDRAIPPPLRISPK